MTRVVSSSSCGRIGGREEGRRSHHDRIWHETHVLNVKTELKTLQQRQQRQHPSAAEDGEDAPVILGCILLNIKLQYIH